jgi:hypothetical protein
MADTSLARQLRKLISEASERKGGSIVATSRSARRSTQPTSQRRAQWQPRVLVVAAFAPFPSYNDGQRRRLTSCGFSLQTLL